MAAVLTGTPVAVTWAAGANPAGQSITIPADATAAYMFWSFYTSADGNGLSNVTLAGNAPAQTFETPTAATDQTGTGVAAWYNPPTGSQTLDPAWDAAPEEGATCIVVFTKDGDTSAWRDADADNQDSTTACSVTLTTVSGDLVLKFDQRFGTVPSLTSGWTNGQTTTNNGEGARLSYISAAGTTQVCASEDDNYSSVCAVSIPAAAGGTPVGMATETDTALALSRLQIRATGLSSETDTSLALSAVQIRSAGNSIETDTALALSALQIRATGMASETDTAFALAAGGAIVGTAVETDSAFALAAVQITATGRADEADTAQALAPVSVRAAGMASETDSALALDRLQITATGLAAETDTAFALQSGALPVGMAVEEDTAFALLPGSSATADGAKFPKRRKLRFYAEDEETPAEEAPKAAPVPEITPPVPQKQQVVPPKPQSVTPAPAVAPAPVFAQPQPPLAPTMTPEEVEAAMVEAEEEAAAMRAAELLLLG